jgi:hypothetical protein
MAQLTDLPGLLRAATKRKTATIIEIVEHEFAEIKQ